MSDSSAPVVTIACDKFKGSLTALEACRAIAAGLPESWEKHLIPIADGGEGFFMTMYNVLGGEIVTCKVKDPFGRIVTATYAISPSENGPVAYMEMAEASGLHLVAQGTPNIMESSTYGTGELLIDATNRGVSQIIIGIGGSATNDGGAGMARALGATFHDRHGKELRCVPQDLKEIARADLSNLFQTAPIVVACDVENPLVGENGASVIFGPQKGATEADIKVLDPMLERLAIILKRQDYAKKPGAGAAGGLGFGLMVFAKASLMPGFDLIAQTLQLEDKIKASDIVITGEGSMDSQTLQGKGPAGIAMLARDLGVPSVAAAGRVTKHIAAAKLFNHTISLADTGLPLETLMNDAAELLTQQLKESQDLLTALVSG